MPSIGVACMRVVVSGVMVRVVVVNVRFHAAGKVERLACLVGARSCDERTSSIDGSMHGMQGPVNQDAQAVCAVSGKLVPQSAPIIGTIQVEACQACSVC